MDPTTPDAPPTPAPPAPAPDATGTGAAAVEPGLAEKIERAASGAVDQHLAESKKSRGQRGPDKKPRKPRVSFPGLDNGAPASPMAEGAPAPLDPVWDAAPAFDEATASALVNIAVNLLNDGAAAIVRAVAKKETGDDALANEAAKSVRMAGEIENSVKKGALECCKKYAVRLDYAPEIMLGGGMVVWAGQVGMTIKDLKAKGRELRGGTPATN